MLAKIASSPPAPRNDTFFWFAVTFFLLFLPGCATLASSFDPQFTADQIAGKNRFHKEIIPTQIFTLTTYSRLETPGKPLTVYIEGDGRAWLSKNLLSKDPTPFHPMVLELAALDPSPNVVYLARPCQYDNLAFQKPCGPEYWSDKRFSEEVISSMNEAVDFFAEKAAASQVHLVGYSGGAAVAVLITERRQDIVSLRTVAGNLDPEALNRHHRVSPLSGSLDPIQAAPKISSIPQRHFIGANDKVVPPSVSENFLRASEDSACVKVTTVEGAGHHSGWAEKWKELIGMPCHCEET